jgi:hypothetical protein
MNAMNEMESAAAEADIEDTDAVSPRNREHSRRGKRKQRTSLSYDNVEWSVIEQAAALEGLRPGAFVSRTALDAARVRVTGVLLDRGVLVKLHEALAHHSNRLAKIGGNLNDIAKHANSTHEVATVREQALAIQAIVRRRVVESGVLQAAVRTALR